VSGFSRTDIRLQPDRTTRDRFACSYPLPAIRTQLVECPIVPARVCVFCRREPAQEPWIPFCSERCKLQDLARWLDDGYRVPGSPGEEREPTDADDEADQ